MPATLVFLPLGCEMLLMAKASPHRAPKRSWGLAERKGCSSAPSSLPIDGRTIWSSVGRSWRRGAISLREEGERAGDAETGLS